MKILVLPIIIGSTLNKVGRLDGFFATSKIVIIDKPHYWLRNQNGTILLDPSQENEFPLGCPHTGPLTQWSNKLETSPLPNNIEKNFSPKFEH